MRGKSQMLSKHTAKHYSMCIYIYIRSYVSASLTGKKLSNITKPITELRSWHQPLLQIFVVAKGDQRTWAQRDDPTRTAGVRSYGWCWSKEANIQRPNMYVDYIYNIYIYIYLHIYIYVVVYIMIYIYMYIT